MRRWNRHTWNRFASEHWHCNHCMWDMPTNLVSVKQQGRQMDAHLKRWHPAVYERNRIIAAMSRD